MNKKILSAAVAMALAAGISGTALAAEGSLADVPKDHWSYQAVDQLVKDSGFPGMKVLEFAFDSRDTGAASDYLPHNYIENCVVYTGTHDNETLQGWFKSINKQEMQMVRDYLCDAKTPIKDLHKPMIAAAMRSNAATCIIPMQDYLGLDNSARTNQPSTVGQNWRWRVSGKALTSKLAQEIRHTADTFGRL